MIATINIAKTIKTVVCEVFELGKNFILIYDSKTKFLFFSLRRKENEVFKFVVKFKSRKN